MILPKIRDPRLITIRRGGILSDDDHHLLANWAADCAERVLHFFEAVAPEDPRPRLAIDVTRAWARGELSMKDARKEAFSSNGAARDRTGAAKLAALAAGQAAAVAHVAAHQLGAAAYTIRAAEAAAQPEQARQARLRERTWQREHLPAKVRELVLEDQQNRNAICWHVFED